MSVATVSRNSRSSPQGTEEGNSKSGETLMVIS
jgi:hypothetical protein